MADRKISKGALIVTSIAIIVFSTIVAAVAISFLGQRNFGPVPPAQVNPPMGTSIVNLVISDMESAIGPEYGDFGDRVGGYPPVVENGKVLYYGAGSSSCPPVVESATLDTQRNLVTLTVKKYGLMACTADLRYFLQEITKPDGSAIPSTVAFQTNE